MSSIPPTSPDLSAKISRLVEEKGWNQEDFARIAQLNRHTVRQIFNDEDGRRLRNTTVSKCAKALGLSVTELRTYPLERLLPRMTGKATAAETLLDRLFAQATLPELRAWLDRNPERASQLNADEVAELLAMQGEGGPLSRIGVERFVSVLERRRVLVAKVIRIAGTEFLEFLEQFVDLLNDKVQPRS